MNAMTRKSSFPWSGLLALATAGFITILTEALPAGLLNQMSAGMNVSQSMVGQLVTIYAVGSLAAAIPLTSYTAGVRRKPLLLCAIAGFLFANTVTAISTQYSLTLAARFVAGVSAGLLWALLAGYASRMVDEQYRGKAIAVAMVGTPLALSIGIPAGTFIGSLIGWRYTFGVMSALTVLLIIWTMLKVPDFPGSEDKKKISVLKVFSIPGIRPILFVVLAYILAHNILYTYIAPFLALSNLNLKTDILLFLFGLFALFGIWFVGVFIDGFLRELTLWSTLLFGLSAFILGLWSDNILAVFSGVALWGLTFGGAATLFQTACAIAAGDSTDTAQSILVTAWNIAIAGGGIIGGVLLSRVGAQSLPWATFILVIPTFLVVLKAKKIGFPRRSSMSS